jgi:hypothetical protein
MAPEDEGTGENWRRSAWIGRRRRLAAPGLAWARLGIGSGRRTRPSLRRSVVESVGMAHSV